jgi:predicted transcriptional regulator
MMTARSLREMREASGLTQTQLAQLAGISQAHVAKIETGKVDPRLSTVNAMLSVIQKKKKGPSCGKIMSRKVVPVKPSDTVKKAIGIMRSLDISQLPVLERGRVLGSISESTVIRHMDRNPAHVRVSEVMEPPFPIVDEEEPADTLPQLLGLRQAVLVTKKGKVTGIITKFNLLDAR